MKRTDILWMTILGVLLLCTACQKEDLPTYNDVERINLDLSGMGVKNDSIEVAFGFTMEDYKDLELKFLVIGYPKDYARKITLKVEGDEGVAEELLEFPDKMEIPANEMETTITCRLTKKSDFIGDGKGFTLNLVESDDFQVGLTTSLYVSVSDDVPTEWIGDAEMFYGMLKSTYFGECSKTKYLFVYRVVGEWDFKNWSAGWGGDHTKARAAKSLLKRELAAYEKENGPLIDPDKGRVTFPD